METTVRNRAKWPLLLGLTIMVFTGCGSSHQTARHSGTTSARASTSPGPVRQRTSFVGQADAVCARINREISAVKAKSGSAAEVKRVVPRIISLERSGIATLEKLNPPASLAQDWQRMLSDRRSLAGMLGELLQIAKTNDGTSIKPLVVAKKRAHTKLAEVAKAAGFKACEKVGRVG